MQTRLRAAVTREKCGRGSPRGNFFSILGNIYLILVHFYVKLWFARIFGFEVNMVKKNKKKTYSQN